MSVIAKSIARKLVTQTYRASIVAGLGAFLFIRRNEIAVGSASNFDTLIAAVFIALLIIPIFDEVTLGGVTLKEKIKEIAHQEVGKAQLEALQLAAQNDLQMMPIWESENSSISSNYREQKLTLLKQKIAELEQLWNNASPDDKAPYGLALRSLYWEWLATARQYYASSMPFHDVWRHVEKGFAELGNVPHTPTR